MLNILTSPWDFHSALLVLKGFLEQFHPGMENSQTLIFKWGKVHNWEQLRQDGAFSEFVIMVFWVYCLWVSDIKTGNLKSSKLSYGKQFIFEVKNWTFHTKQLCYSFPRRWGGKTPSLFLMHTFMEKNAFIQTLDGREVGLKSSCTGLNREADLLIDYIVFK